MSEDLLITRYVLVAVWAVLAVVATILAALYIKKHCPFKPVMLIVSLGLTIVSYAGILLWTINFEFYMIYISVLWFALLGSASGTIIQKYRSAYGKEKLANIIYFANIPAIRFAYIIKLLAKTLYQFLSSLIKSDIKETNAQIKLDKDVDDYLYNHVVKYTPYSSIDYQNNLSSSYNDFIRRCGYDDSYKVKNTFESKYFDYIYKK